MPHFGRLELIFLLQYAFERQGTYGLPPGIIIDYPYPASASLA
jgi:hypothetical protein